jgi:hypothetical protein
MRMDECFPKMKLSSSTQHGQGMGSAVAGQLFQIDRVL